MSKKSKQLEFPSIEDLMARVQKPKTSDVSAPTAPPRDMSACASEHASMSMARGDFGKRIPLEHKKGIKHKNPIFPDGHLSITITGASGCGKSYLLLSILPQIADLSQVIVCSLISSQVYDTIGEWCATTPVERGGHAIAPPSSTAGAPSTTSASTSTASSTTVARSVPKDKHAMIEYAQFSDPQSALEGIPELIERKPLDTYGIIIFDDFSRATTSNSDPCMQLQNMCTMQLRNYGYHSAILTQQYTNIGTKSRTNENMMFAFGMHDINAVNRISQDFVSATGWDPLMFKEFYHGIANESHAYFLVVIDGSSKSKVYRKCPRESEELQLVQIGDDLDEVINDSKLVSLIRALKGLIDRSGPTTSGVRSTTIARARQAIKKYIDYLSDTNSIERADIEEAVYEKYGPL